MAAKERALFLSLVMVQAIRRLLIQKKSLVSTDRSDNHGVDLRSVKLRASESLTERNCRGCTRFSMVFIWKTHLFANKKMKITGISLILIKKLIVVMVFIRTPQRL